MKPAAKTLKIYTAKKIYPVSSEPIENGTVVTKNGKIVAIGTQKGIKERFSYPASSIECRASIIPAFVNAHTHLELDQFAGRVKIPQDFVPWIEEASMIFQKEFQENLHPEINADSLKKVGICAIGDISSVGFSPKILNESGVSARIFHEGLDVLSANTEATFLNLKSRKNRFPNSDRLSNHFSPHTIWTTTEFLFKKINEIERFSSPHLAESPAETEFLKTGKGNIRQMKMRNNSLRKDWQPPGISPVRYFLRNNFATDWTLLVHMVQIEDSDWEILEQNKNKIAVCLCPISNKNLNCGIAPGREFLDRGFTVALGTDSAMSGESLDMLAVINSAMSDYGFSFEEALKCATLGGAKALKFDDKIGSIEVGKEAQLLAFDGKKIEWLEGVGK